MNLFGVFRLCLYLLVILAALMLAKAEALVTPALLTPLVGIAAYFVIERGGRDGLSQKMAGGFGVAAILLAFAELFAGTQEARLLAGAHLTVYFSWILLWQQKVARHYWMLCALTVLQVALGAILTQEGTFGFLVVIYALLGMWTLSLLSLHLIRERIASEERLTGQDMIEQLRTGASMEVVSSRTMQTRGAVQRDPNERWIGARFFSGYCLTAMLAFLVAGLFFAFIPRTWLSGESALAQAYSPLAGTSITGFSSDVQLGGAGEILESTNTVMEVKLTDTETGDEIPVSQYAFRMGFDEPYFRGNVQDAYRADQQRWEATHASRRSIGLQDRLTPANVERYSVHQHILLRPIKEPTLFAMAGVAGGEGGRVFIKSDPVTKVLRQRSGRRLPFRYRLHTVRSLPAGARKLSLQHVQDREHDRNCSRVPRDIEGGDFLIAEARRVALDNPDNPAATPARRKAERLVAYLRDSGEFGYTLVLDRVDTTIDPIVDFLKNRKEGHCAYYASALALMLRSVGVPARLVNGFKGGVQNSVSGTFVVQERHAHAWVEALIGGRWETLDATPADARNAEMTTMGDRFGSWSSFTAWLSDFWQSGIMNLSLEKQRTQIYGPIRDSIAGWWTNVKKSGSPIKAIFSSLGSFLSSPEKWFSPLGLVITFALLLLLVGLVWLLRRLFRLIRWAIGKEGGEAGLTAVAIEFFERFQTICRKRGLVRRPAQTPREFAGEVKRQTDAVLIPAGLGTLPDQLVFSFYDLRYGAKTVAPQVLSSLGEQLSHLEQAWSIGKNGDVAAPASDS